MFHGLPAVFWLAATAWRKLARDATEQDSPYLN
jgi:hypothetical protein